MMLKLPDINKELVAIVPRYGDSGDYTEIIFATGEKTVLAKKAPSIIRQLAKSQAIDLSVLKERMELKTLRTLFLPLPLRPGLILMPVKVRSPVVTGDSAMAYINCYKVTYVKENKTGPYRCLIEFSEPEPLYSLWSASTVNKHLVLARLAAGERLDHSNTSRDGYFRVKVDLLAVKLAEIIYDILEIKSSYYKDSPKPRPEVKNQVKA